MAHTYVDDFGAICLVLWVQGVQVSMLRADGHMIPPTISDRYLDAAVQRKVTVS